MLSNIDITAIEKMATEWFDRQSIEQLCNATPGDVLNLVATVSEIARRWDKNPKSVMLAIHPGGLRGRQSETIWLIDVRSARERWGSEKSRLVAIGLKAA